MALKVFGGLMIVNRMEVRTIVAASSQKKGAELLGVSLGYFRDYFPETFNDLELETALAQPGVVFKAADRLGQQFVPDSQ